MPGSGRAGENVTLHERSADEWAAMYGLTFVTGPPSDYGEATATLVEYSA